MAIVSIIVPIYNAESFLHKCVESILGQTVTDIEVILVNDGSKDNSLEICNEFKKKDPRVKVIDKPNSGVSDSRNHGIENATGSYFMFVDADDWLPNNALETFMPYIYSYDIIRCSAYAVYKHKVRHFRSCKSSDKKDIIKAIISQKTIVACWAAIFRRELFMQHDIRFDRSLNIGEDWLVTAQTTNACQTIKLLPDAYGYYYNRINEQSCTNTMESGKIIKQFDVLNKIRSVFPSGYDHEFRFSKCILAQEAIKNCGMTEVKRILEETGHEITSKDILHIWITTASIRKKLRLLFFWFRSNMIPYHLNKA